MLMDKYYPQYAVAVSKTVFRLFNNEEFQHLIESHISIKKLREMRERGGAHNIYLDSMVPSHFHQYSNQRDPEERLLAGVDVVKELDPLIDPKIKRIKERIDAGELLSAGLSAAAYR